MVALTLRANATANISLRHLIGRKEDILAGALALKVSAPASMYDRPEADTCTIPRGGVII